VYNLRHSDVSVKQEQIARQLRTQYVEGIYRHNYPVTLKSKYY